MAKLLFVVHRYAPYPGGSEYYVANMAEEAARRGHDVSVLATEHKGPHNGIRVHSSFNELLRPYDLIIVHGADVSAQNVVHQNYASIKSPVLYMIIKPTDSPTGIMGLAGATFLGCSTIEDQEHCIKYGFGDKIVEVRHGIPIEASKRPKMWETPFFHFVSVGGFWPHKGFKELAEAFIDVTDNGYPNAWLHLYGYDDNGKELIPYHPRVTAISDVGHDRVLEAIANADAYIMNSYEEGFGLVLLEASVNKVPWFARNIAGARLMHEAGHGYVYDNIEELKLLMKATIEYKQYCIGQNEPNYIDEDDEKTYQYVVSNHSIKNTIDDIERCVNNG